MIQLGIDYCKNLCFSINTLEGERRDSPSYTFDTMLELKEQYPNAELILLLGEDSLMTLHTWYKATKLAKQWKILTYPRKNHTPSSIQQSVENRSLNSNYSRILNELSNFWPDEIASKLTETILPFKIYDISSTEIRHKIQNGEEVDNMLFQKIIEYINKRGLYRSGK
jgi:nicotinate-nucleotide adenylyltransferase